MFNIALKRNYFIFILNIWRLIVIKLKEILNNIIKADFFKLLLEAETDSDFKSWPSTFVIGADAKLIRGIRLHGYALINYPDLWNAAALLFGGDAKLESMIKAGTNALYKFMYNQGMVRGGGSGEWAFVSFNKQKISNESLMTILRLMKGSNIEKVMVSSVGIPEGMSTELTPEEFIDKYL